VATISKDCSEADDRPPDSDAVFPAEPIDLLPWVVFKRLLERYPRPSPIAVHSVYRLVGEPVT
jgi:hypothetical protein